MIIETMDVITRYFLRRLAVARHKRGLSTEASRYHYALVEVILLVLALPSIAVFSFALLATLKWSVPFIDERWPGFSIKTTALVVYALTLVAGHRWLGRRFRIFRDDPTAPLRFDTETDHRIVFWQKFIVVLTCGLIIPCLGLLASYFNP
jgi:hypothetical protein